MAQVGCSRGQHALTTTGAAHARNFLCLHSYTALKTPRNVLHARRSLLDLECFVLSGMTARDTLCAEMAFMFAERGAGRGRIDYPVRGVVQMANSICCRSEWCSEPELSVAVSACLTSTRVVKHTS